MKPAILQRFYEGYIACLNAQAWERLGTFVAGQVAYNGQAVGLAGYRAMLERDYALIPDLRFNIAVIAVQPPWVAARLLFDCSPNGVFLGLTATGKRITFSENVFYRVVDGKIVEVQSVIDKAAIEAQL